MSPLPKQQESWKLIGLIQKQQNNAETEGQLDLNLVKALTGTPKTIHDDQAEAIEEDTSPHANASFLSKLDFVTIAFLLAIVLVGIRLLELTGAAGTIIDYALITCLLIGLFCLKFSLSGRKIKKAKTLDRHKAEIENFQDQVWELREREHRHSMLVEAFGDMIMDRQPDGAISYINPAFAHFLEMTEAGLLKRPFPAGLQEEGSGSVDRMTEHIQQRCFHINGKTKWLAWLDLPLRLDGTKTTAYRTVARDITVQKQTELELISAREKAESASHAKTRFLANVSHEMRTPLNGILGMSGLLVDTKLSPEQSSYVNAVHDSGVALLTLIEDILDMTLVEAGKLEFRAVQVSPQRLVEDVCELLAPRAHAKNISIASCICDDIPSEIETDAGRLRQVLINLIGNAIKFTETGGVFISLERSAKPVGGQSDTRLSFSITDTGPGISKRDQEVIFEEFSQADSKSTRKHGGAGLGLTISRRIIHEMGGEVSLESTLDKGSTFSFDMVAKIIDAAPPSTAIIPLDNSTRKIALVSDDPVTTLGLESYFKKDGQPEITVLKGNEAAEQFDNNDANIVLIDAAIDADIARVKSLRMAGSRNIILLNPQQRPQLEGFLKSGFDGYLIKPIRKASLVNIVFARNLNSGDGKEESRAQKWMDGVASGAQSRSILLAEDNDINALLARSILQKSGHTVTRAANGEEAMAIWQERRNQDPFDLILLDLQMPVMDGMEVLEKIRSVETRENKSRIPIVVLSADEEMQTKENVMRMGADNFLTKPLEPEKLFAMIGELDYSPNTQTLDTAIAT